LERLFEEEEVLEVMKAMNSDKTWALVVSMVFFQAACDVIKVDIMNIFQNFHARGKFERSLNATFVALIRKKVGVVDIKSTLWSVLFSIFDVKWVMNGRVIDLLACCKGQRGNKLVMEVWRMAPLCLMWTILRERNTRCFEDKEMTMAEFSNRFLNLFFHWAVVLNIPQVSLRHQFVDLHFSFYF
jgi:hypothetical protein